MQKVFKICLCLKLLSFSKHKSKTEFLLLRPQWMYFFKKKKCLPLTEDPTTKLQHVNRHNLSCGRETPNYQNKFFTRNFIIRNFRVFELRLEIKKVLVTILIKTNNLQLKFTIFSTLYHILKITARFNLLRQRYIRYCFFLQYIFFMEGFL